MIITTHFGYDCWHNAYTFYSDQMDYCTETEELERLGRWMDRPELEQAKRRLRGVSLNSCAFRLLFIINLNNISVDTGNPDTCVMHYVTNNYRNRVIGGETISLAAHDVLNYLFRRDGVLCRNIVTYTDAGRSHRG